MSVGQHSTDDAFPPPHMSHKDTEDKQTHRQRDKNRQTDRQMKRAATVLPMFLQFIVRRPERAKHTMNVWAHILHPTVIPAPQRDRSVRSMEDEGEVRRTRDFDAHVYVSVRSLEVMSRETGGVEKQKRESHIHQYGHTLQTVITPTKK